MAICRQACPYNTLDGCKVKECGGFCKLTNTVQPITEYRMTNADRIRSMSDEELTQFLNQWGGTSTRAWQKDKGETMYWLQQPAEEDDYE